MAVSERTAPLWGNASEANCAPAQDRFSALRGSPLVPNLFVIGSSKSGTSAFHAYLDCHPDIAMSAEKEPCFFVEREQLEVAWPIMARRACSHDSEAYLALWSGCEDARYRGEASVYYSQAPLRSGIAARIANVAPDARIIYLVREPVSRALGHYWQRYKEFQETRPIEQAVRENPLYRDTSDYALQLQEYLEHFDKSQILVIAAEDLRRKRRETLDECFSWLGLAPFAFQDEQLTDRHRSPPTSRRQRFPFVRGLRNSKPWAWAREHLPASLVNGLRSVSTVRFDKADVDESAARAYLTDYLSPRQRDFEALIGRRIDAW